MFSDTGRIRSAISSAWQSLLAHKGRTSIAIVSIAWGMGILEATLSIINGYGYADLLWRTDAEAEVWPYLID